MDRHQFNAMLLLRTVVLLLLCVSVGLCATLAHYQTPAEEEEEEAPAVIDGAVTAASLDAAEEEPAANSLFGNSLPAKILAVDKPAADKVADGATAKEPETDSDRPAGDTPALEAVPGEDATQKQPSSSSVEEGNDIRPVQTNRSLNRPVAHEDSSWSINSIRNSFQTVHGYFDSLVELVGGHNGVCQYRCRYGKSESLELTRSYVTEIHKCFSVLEVVLGVLRGSDR